ncbi:MAG: type II secretion system protein [Candidatus Cloacimonetes bacterium]|nr:type II secretion system protein [Candidatus Cloacimonadota bacterium]
MPWKGFLMWIQGAHKRGFTLIEVLVVVMIVGIMAAWAITSINQAIQVQRQLQAAELVGATIRYIRTNALATEVDTNNSVYYVSDASQKLPTRNAFSLYICEGWVDPEDLRETVADPADTTERYSRGYSILGVNDPGYPVDKRVIGPDVSTGTGAGVATLRAIETGVALSSNLQTRQHFVNLPEGVHLHYGSATDSSLMAAGALITGCQHVTYTHLGQLNTKISFAGSPPYTSAGFVNQRTHIAVTIGSDGIVNSRITPVYVDLRTGDRIKNTDSMTTVSPSFQN